MISKFLQILDLQPRITNVFLDHKKKIWKEIPLTISGWSCFFDPIGQMSNKIEKEIAFRYGNDFVSNFHKKTETFGRSQIQALSNAVKEKSIYIKKNIQIHLKI